MPAQKPDDGDARDGPPQAGGGAAHGLPPPGPPAAPADDGEPDDGAARRKPFLLRLPPELMAELRAWSAQELRSLNGHLEFLLREAVRQRKRAERRKDAP